MFDLATALIHAPVPVPMDINITPNDNGLPSIAQLRTIVGAVVTIGPIRAHAYHLRDCLGLRCELLQPAPGRPRQGRRPRLL